jgi:hypothetical protein
MLVQVRALGVTLAADNGAEATAPGSGSTGGGGSSTAGVVGGVVGGIVALAVVVAIAGKLHAGPRTTKGLVRRGCGLWVAAPAWSPTRYCGLEDKWCGPLS